MLVFPRVLKGGAGFGGEYGQGALRVAGKTVDYYSMLQGSFGFQLGGEIKTVFIVFLDEGALKGFRESEGWKAGVDGSVALVTLGAGGTIDTQNMKEPIVAFVLGQKGLIASTTRNRFEMQVQNNSFWIRGRSPAHRGPSGPSRPL